MGTLGTRARNGGKPARGVERPHPAVAKLAAVLKEHKKSLEQHAATAEILRAMSGSPGDAQPVFEAIVDKAHRLCAASYSVLYRYDGKLIHFGAAKDVKEKSVAAVRGRYPQPPDRHKLVGRTVLEGKVFHTVDLARDDRFPAAGKIIHRRAVVSVPLLRNGAVLGVISCGRVEAKAFTKKEIGLLKTFADQAVIAIENARLFHETREALERQTATAEILKIISSSPADVQPVFDAIARNAMRLLGGFSALVTRRIGDALHLAAFTATSESGNEMLKSRYPVPLSERSRQHVKAVLTKAPAYTTDYESPSVPPAIRELARARGYRSGLAVPMICEGEAIGTIAISRREPGPFSSHHIELLKTFADQAVIAIENARLFNETKEALEHQKASADILRIVASSVENTDPVFAAITSAGMHLFPGVRVSLSLARDGQVHYVSHSGVSEERRTEVAKLFPRPLDRETVVAASIVDSRMVHVPDISVAADKYPVSAKTSGVSGWTAMLAVPLLENGKAIGCLGMSRATPGPFSDKQIALAQTFADQAVIAIRNARLFNETKEALEHQKVSADILRIVASSVANTDPVFRAITDAGMRLVPGCRLALHLLLDGHLHHISHSGVDPNHLAKMARFYPIPVADAERPSARAVHEKRVVHIADIEALDEMALGREMARVSGWRAILAVPLMRAGEAIGNIAITRSTPGLFSAKQIVLMQTFADQAVIALENARLFNETKEALEKQTATAEILRVLSANPSDTQPVFEAIVRHAAKLCDSVYANVFRYDGERLHLAASEGASAPVLASLKAAYPMEPNRSRVVGRVVLEKRVVRVENTAKDADYDRAFAEVSHHRRILGVPLMRGAQPVGAITIGWAEPGPILDRHEDLLKTFADQAVIAIENVRLFNETKEALEQQTATAEILRVIASSPSDVNPVMAAVVENAARLADADHVLIGRTEGGNIRWLAAYGCPLPVQPRPITRALPSGRAMLDLQTTQVEDVAQVIWDPGVEQAYRELGVRSIVAAPLVREGLATGVLLLRRTQVRRFSEKQVALLNTFADQAAIAIENVRLFNETKEALERQTAISEILEHISRSPTDVRPVMQAVVERAARLCEAEQATVALVDGDRLSTMINYSVDHGPMPGTDTLILLDRRYITGRAVVDGEVVNVEDAVPLLDTEFPLARENQQRIGFRSMLAVPLMREQRAIGVIGLWRREVRPFSEKQVALAKTFAGQAAIAIENVRLFDETKEALEQQKASAEVLATISSSIADTKPVFDKIIESCVRLFDGHQIGILLASEDGLARVVAYHGEKAGDLQPVPITEESATGRSILSRKVLHIPDIAGGVDVPAHLRPNAEKFGIKAGLFAPMLWEGRGVGCIYVGRKSVGAFSEKAIRLLKTFADQAAIAIQNVRLFNETNEALERQTATSEVLRVISRSPTDVQPVFDAIVQAADRLCDGRLSTVLRFDGESLDLVAHHNLSAEGLAAYRRFYPQRVSCDTMAGRALLDRKVLNIIDSQEDADIPPQSRAMAVASGFRSVVVVPMLRDGVPIGVLNVARAEPGSFSEAQVELLKTFADQAVIAIENVRLFNETKDALEQQTAIGEVLRVISGSPTDVKPVLEAVAARAARICDAADSRIFLVEGEQYRHAAGFGEVGVVTDVIPVNRDTPSGRAIIDRTTQHIEDITSPSADEFPLARELAALSGWRTILTVPLLREDRALGTIVLRRKEVRRFTDQQVAVLKTFADQAAIAIENVRLFNQTKEALEQQTATAEILKVISSSPTATQPVFEAIVQSAARLFAPCNAVIVMREGELLQRKARAGPPRSIDQAALANIWPLPFDPERSMAARCIVERRIIEIPDTEAPGLPPIVKPLAKAAGYRSITNVPLLREGEGIGLIALSRPEPGFKLTEKQLALVRTFADQAVIAIENVRLFKELEARTEALTRSVGQLTALGEVGQAISSTLDLETVLKTIVSRAVQLTRLDTGAVYEYDERLEEFHLRAAENMSEEVVQLLRATPIRKGDGAVGGTAVSREPIQVPETRDKSYKSRLRDFMHRTGRRALLAVPLMRDEQIIGALAVSRNTPGPFAPEVVELLKTFATQSAMAIQNARLFREIADKGKQLEIASRHKSDFLASMSHELRTPLNALLGFNELIMGDVYGEVPADMKPPLEQMQLSGKHLLRLINNVLDLAKIEAGRMELALADYSVHDIVESVRSSLRPLAQEKGLEFVADIPADIPLAHGDPGRITQCLMNLAGNSLKFTKAGKVEISVALNDSRLRYRVADTGIGIPAEKIGNLFTEFKQTDATIASEYGGTGLGLSISKKFVELHGGRIWVESQVGKGSAFSFEVPLRAGTA